MVPFPYDWIAGWKEENKIELSDKAEKELVDIFERVCAPVEPEKKD